jgi:hypothetical protein
MGRRIRDVIQDINRISGRDDRPQPRRRGPVAERWRQWRNVEPDAGGIWGVLTLLQGVLLLISRSDGDHRSAEERIKDALAVQRGNVRLSNLQVLNAVLYVAANGRDSKASAEYSLASRNSMSSSSAPQLRPHHRSTSLM